MSKVFFWDEDTQEDFINPKGKLYVPGTEEIIPNLAQLTLYARHHGIRILGSVDWHQLNDSEISNKPDLTETFPPHCIVDTPGASKIKETQPEHPLWIDRENYLWKEIERKVSAHSGEIFFRKNTVDPFVNPNVDKVLKILRPSEIVFYGVYIDFCDAYGIQGFLKRKNYEVFFVEDAAKAVSLDRAKALMKLWVSQGVRIVQTQDILKGMI